MVEPDAAQPKAYAHTPEDETDHFTCVASFAKDEQGTLIDRVLSQERELLKKLAPREAADLQNKGELYLVGQSWSDWLGADAC